MKQTIALSLLAALSTAVHQDIKQISVSRDLINAQVTATHTCKENILKVKAWDYTRASVNNILNGVKKLYIDDDFPIPKNKSAVQDALFWNAPFKKGGDTTKTDAATTYWARAYSSAWQPNAKLFDTSVDVYDVDQGQIGDCYFLDAISSLAMSDYRLMNAFITDVKNPQGIFALQVYIRGVPKILLVDDYIPFYGKYFLSYNFIVPYSAQQAGDGSTWAQVLEKAWAKTNANYNNINAGNAGEVWSFLSGIPSKYYRMNDASTINNDGTVMWQLLNDAMLKNQIASLGTGATTLYNLVAGHAYTVLGTFNYTDESDVSHLLVKIRNPWGRDVYDDTTMLWGDNDTASWTLEASNFLPWSNKSDDGAFFMDASQTVQAFAGLQIGYYFDNYMNNYLDFKNDNGVLNTFTITISDPGNWYIGMELYNPRLWVNACKDTTTAIMYLYSPSGSALSGYSVADYNNFAYFNYENLTPGTYKLTIKAKWAGALDMKDFTVRAYGPGNAVIKGKKGTTVLTGTRNPIIANFTSFSEDNEDGAIGYNGTQVQYNNNTEGGSSSSSSSQTQTNPDYVVYGDSVIGQNLIDSIIATDKTTGTLTDQTYFQEYHKQLNTPIGGRSGIDYYIHFEGNPTTTKSNITLSFVDPSATIAYIGADVTCYPQVAPADPANANCTCILQTTTKTNCTFAINIPTENVGTFTYNYNAAITP